MLNGGAGIDSLKGGGGADALCGGAGADNLIGGPGDDLLRGGAGVDRLEGGAGADRLIGDAGADLFSANALSDIDGDMIVDYEAGEVVRIEGVELAPDAVRVGSANRVIEIDGDGDGAFETSFEIGGSPFMAAPTIATTIAASGGATELAFGFAGSVRDLLAGMERGADLRDALQMQVERAQITAEDERLDFAAMLDADELRMLSAQDEGDVHVADCPEDAAPVSVEWDGGFLLDAIV